MGIGRPSFRPPCLVYVLDLDTRSLGVDCVGCSVLQGEAIEHSSHGLGLLGQVLLIVAAHPCTVQFVFPLVLQGWWCRVLLKRQLGILSRHLATLGTLDRGSQGMSMWWLRGIGEL